MKIAPKWHGFVPTALIVLAVALAVELPVWRSIRASAEARATRTARAEAIAAIRAKPAAQTPPPGSVANDTPASASPVPVPASSSGYQYGSTSSDGATSYFTPPQLGAGAVIDPDLSRAPVVPAGTSPDEYMTRYYEALLAGDIAKAWSLVPRASARPDLKDFEARQYGYELGSYAVLGSWPTVTGDTEGLVTHTTRSNGSFIVTWTFVKTPRGLVVKDLTYARPGGKACH